MHRLRDSPLEAPAGESVIAPVSIDGLPPEIDALGRRWQRKVEFHMTVLAAAVIEQIGGGDAAIWERVAGLLAGQTVGPIFVTREVRRVRDPERAELETLVVMVQCPALEPLYAELSIQLEAELTAPPAHVTLYSTHPEEGIGINDLQQLRERAPGLSEEEQEEVRRGMGFDEVFVCQV